MKHDFIYEKQTKIYLYIFFIAFGFVFMFDLLLNFTSLFLLSLPACL